MAATAEIPARTLARHGLRPKKELGQNFLSDPSMVDAIVAFLPVEPTAVVEIGAGTGVMTRELVATGRQVSAIELDPQLARLLSQEFRRSSGVTVIHGDALKLDVASLLPSPYAVFGNIPYQITGALIPRLLTAQPSPEWVCLLVQKEVAERLAAAPGGWSLATLAARAYADAEVALTVPAAAFLPVPKVDSALVMLTPRKALAVAGPPFFAFARAVFQERRKKLSNAVANALEGDVAAARRVLDAAGIDAARRPQTLDLEEWERLYRACERPAA